MKIKSVACSLVLGGMVAGSYTEPAKASPASLDPGTALAITVAGVVLLEAPRLLGYAKAHAEKLLEKAWTKVKPPIIKVANTAAAVGAGTGTVLALAGALCERFEFNESFVGQPINKKTFYSISATLLPLSYLVYYTARKLSKKPKPNDKKKQQQPLVEVRVNGVQVATP